VSIVPDDVLSEELSSLDVLSEELSSLDVLSEELSSLNVLSEKETIVNLGNVYSFGFGFTYRLFRKQFSVL